MQGMYLSDKEFSVVRVGSSEFNANLASILAKVINKEVDETKTSF